jgi:hypothetical protein
MPRNALMESQRWQSPAGGLGRASQVYVKDAGP